MKRLLLFSFIMHCAYSCYGQNNINAYEYWFNGNYAGKVFNSVSADSVFRLQTSVSTTGLGNGLHTFHIRFRDDSSRWSSVASKLLTAGNLTGYEYWFDNLYSEKVTQAVSPTQTLNISQSIVTPNLSPGLHTFNIRCMNEYGIWTSVITRYFLSYTNLVGYEYWFDNNVADKVSQSVSPAQEINVSQSLNVDHLSPGFHVFNFRCQNEGGLWSSVKSSYFLRLSSSGTENVITAYRYWFDNDISSLVTKFVPVPSSFVQLTDSNITLGADSGIHTLNIQFKDTTQLWSSVISKVITKFNDTTLNIQTGTVAGPICPGSSFSVPYTAFGYFAPSNIFTAQLSDASGDFSNPLNIGTLASSSSGLISAVIPFGTVAGTGYRIRVTGSLPGFTGSLSPNDITLYPSTTPPVINSGGNTSFCPGDSVQLSSSGIHHCYLWSTGETSSSIIVHTAGSYTLTIVDANNCSVPSVPETIVVLTPPSVSINADGPLHFCLGGNVNLTASAGISYQWSTGASTQTIQADASGLYSVIVTGSNTCTGTAQQSVIVQQPIAPPVVGSNSPVCHGTQLHLSATGGTSYVWTGPDNFLSYSENPVINNAASLNDGIYTVTITDGGPCTATGSVTVQVLPLSTLPVITADGPVIFCNGDSVHLSSVDSYPSYLWSTGETTASIRATAAGNYTLTITDNINCPVTSLPLTITHFPSPAVSITPDGPTTFCFGDSVELVSTNANSYQWSNGSTLQSITVYTTGLYSVTITDLNNCTATAHQFVNVDLPISPPLLTSNNAPVCIGSTLELYADAGSGFIWTGPDNFTSNIQNPVIPNVSPANSGTYTLTITNGGTCTATASLNVSIDNNHSPVLTVTGNSGFVNGLVNPAEGEPLNTYSFEVRYTDADNDPVATTYPRIQLDYEGNGSYSNLYDRLFIMSSMNTLDSVTTDGKDFFYSTPFLKESEFWKTKIIVLDSYGCTGVIGPDNEPSVVRKPDVAIFANDISFSNSHPNPGTYITVFAKIHNNSSRSAENFNLRLVNQYDTTMVFPDIRIAYLGPNSTYNANWTILTPSLPAWCPMQVIADYDNEIIEYNELDNSAIRPFTNGNFSLPGGIIITSDAEPDTVCPGSAVSIVGDAFYYGLSIQLADSSCAGGSVTATIVETGQSFLGYTNSRGEYNIQVYAPSSTGLYHVRVEATDFTLSSNVGTCVFYTLPSCAGGYGGGGGGGGSFSGFGGFGGCTPGPLVPELGLQGAIGSIGRTPVVSSGQVVNAYVSWRNNSGLPTDSTIFLVQTDGQFSSPLGNVVVPPLMPNESVSIPLGPLTFNNIGTGYVDFNVFCVSYFPVIVIPALPDIVPGTSFISTTCLKNITYEIKNEGGASTGIFSARLIIYSGNTIEAVYIMPVQDIPALQSTYISFTHTPLGTGLYSFVLECDYQNVVTEQSEVNNTDSTSKHINACDPDLIISDCGYIDIKPVDRDTSQNVSISAIIRNIGLSTANGPFTIAVNSGGIIYTYVFSGQLNPGQFQQVTLSNIILPNNVDSLLTVTADYYNDIQEMDDANNVFSDSLFYDFRLSRLANTPDAVNMFWDHVQHVNQPLYLKVGLTNTGLLDASHLKVKFEVKSPGSMIWDSIGVASVYSPNTISTTDTLSCKSDPFMVTLPSLYAFQVNGVYQVRMTADYNNEYIERNESNNSLTVEVRVADSADYRILSQYISPSLLNPDLNEPVTFSITYENMGNSNIDSLELCLKGDTSAIDSAMVTGLPGQFFNTVQFPVTWSSSVRGMHVIRAIIDHDSIIPETNELNNEATRAILVGNFPNLKVDSIFVTNQSPNIGSVITISSVIRNEGFIGCEATYQLFYIDNASNNVFINQQPINIDSAGKDTVTINWVVTDPRTLIIGRIVNGFPMEYDLTDNSDTTDLGILSLQLTTYNATCSSSEDGGAKVTVSGGAPPYLIQWNNGFSGDSIVAIPGLYTVTVTDAEGFKKSISDSIFINAGPEIDTLRPLYGIIGSEIYVDGNRLSLVTEVSINSIMMPFTHLGDTQLVVTVPVGSEPGDIYFNTLCDTFDARYFAVSDSFGLNLRVYIEGFYLGNGMMQTVADPGSRPDLCDSIIVELHNGTSPYNIIFVDTGTININGIGDFVFPKEVEGESYFIVVRHRNAIETWSGVPVLFGSVNTSYSFTDAITKAYGSNLKDFGDGNFAIWSGDISDQNSGMVGEQDGVVESQDYLDMENAVSIVLFGYFPQDLTGDGVVESTDYLIMENNVTYLIFAVHP